ncbi:MAG: hypothetical protein R3F08_14835 [Dokdonella sp.]
MASRPHFSLYFGFHTKGKDGMDFKALLLAVAGALVAAFYGLESFLFFQANGFAPPLLVKMLICGIGIYFFGRNVVRIKKGAASDRPGNAA